MRRSTVTGTCIEPDVPRVLDSFGLRRVEPSHIERLPVQVKNINFRVRTDKGDWVLKRYPHGHSERLRLTHGLELLLGETDFPTARLQRSETGETLVAHAGAWYSLHSWVEGHQISIDQREQTATQHPAIVEELGGALGTFHALTDGMLHADGATAEAAHLLASGKRAATAIRRGRPPNVFPGARLRLRRHKSAFDNWLVATLPSIYREAEILATAPGTAVDSSDVVVSHHDVNWENLLFDDQFKLVALLDFDNARRLPRTLDVGLAAAVLTGADPERLRRFLGAYESTSGHAVDPEAVMLGMRLKCVRSILWSASAYIAGRVGDTSKIATWCQHLEECLHALPRSDR